MKSNKILNLYILIIFKRRTQDWLNFIYKMLWILILIDVLYIFYASDKHRQYRCWSLFIASFFYIQARRLLHFILLVFYFVFVRDRMFSSVTFLLKHFIYLKLNKTKNAKYWPFLSESWLNTNSTAIIGMNLAPFEFPHQSPWNLVFPKHSITK